MSAQPSFIEYQKFLKEKKPFKVKDKTYYLKNNALLSEVFNLLPCAVYILNYQTGKYLFVSDSVEDILQISPEEFLEKGNALFTSLIHEDDFRYFSNEVFKEFVQSCNNSDTFDFRDLCFSFNYRIKRKDKNFIHVLQQFSIAETTPDHFPLIAIGFITDISSFKRDNDVNYSVTRKTSKSQVELITPSSFPDSKMNISKREIEVLKKLVTGLTSKEIADELSISPFTVTAHRRNLMEKTATKSTAELINYAIKSGFI